MTRLSAAAASFSLSLILLVTIANAFVTQPKQHTNSIQRQHRTSQPQHLLLNDNHPSSSLSHPIQIPWSKRTFSRGYGTNLPDEDLGVIIPQDGFGSPCVIKVSEVAKIPNDTMGLDFH